MAKRTGAYRSEKRKKELVRQKRQEEKRQKRFKKDEGGQETEPVAHENEGEVEKSDSPEDNVNAVEEPVS